MASWFLANQMFQIVAALTDLHQYRGTWSSSGSAMSACVLVSWIDVEQTAVIGMRSTVHLQILLARGHSQRQLARSSTLLLWQRGQCVAASDLGLFLNLHRLVAGAKNSTCHRKALIFSGLNFCHTSSQRVLGVNCHCVYCSHRCMLTCYMASLFMIIRLMCWVLVSKMALPSFQQKLLVMEMSSCRCPTIASCCFPVGPVFG